MDVNNHEELKIDMEGHQGDAEGGGAAAGVSEDKNQKVLARPFMPSHSKVPLLNQSLARRAAAAAAAASSPSSAGTLFMRKCSSSACLAGPPAGAGGDDSHCKMTMIRSSSSPSIAGEIGHHQVGLDHVF